MRNHNITIQDNGYYDNISERMIRHMPRCLIPIKINKQMGHAHNIRIHVIIIIVIQEGIIIENRRPNMENDSHCHYIPKRRIF